MIAAAAAAAVLHALYSAVVFVVHVWVVPRVVFRTGLGGGKLPRDYFVYCLLMKIVSQVA